jgi:hypothetical protein
MQTRLRSVRPLLTTPLRAVVTLLRMGTSPSPRHAHSGACRRRLDAVGLLGASGAVGDASGYPSEPFPTTQV